MFLMFVPSKSVAVNGHLWLHLRFLGMCVYFFMYTPNSNNINFSRL